MLLEVAPAEVVEAAGGGGGDEQRFPDRNSNWFRFRLLIFGDPIFIDSKLELRPDGGDVDSEAAADDP